MPEETVAQGGRLLPESMITVSIINHSEVLVREVHAIGCVGCQADGRKKHERHIRVPIRLIALAPEMVDALRQIAKGEGAFSRDPLEHATNVIEEHKAISRALLARLDG